MLWDAFCQKGCKTQHPLTPCYNNVILLNLEHKGSRSVDRDEPIAPSSRTEAASFTEELSTATTQFPLRDLCAMLSPLHPVLALKPPHSLKNFRPHPLRDLCDLCAMLSPLHPVLALKPPRSLKDFDRKPQFPSVTSVTSVRCFPLFFGNSRSLPDAHRVASLQDASRARVKGSAVDRHLMPRDEAGGKAKNAYA
jgi:hypothetical protein